MRPLIFVDVETGGLDPQNDALIEVAAVRMYGDLPPVMYHTHILPEGNMSPKACEVNGYDEQVWRENGAISLADAMKGLSKFFNESGKKAFFCGHNPRFDYEFLKCAFKRAHLEFPAVDYHLVDTASLAFPLLFSGDVESLSLGSLCEFMDIAPQPDHSAFNDVCATVGLFHALIGLFMYKAGEDGNIQ